MKQTLLEIVQDILSAMSSDEVNSISDTEEAEAVARIVRDVYNDIVSRANYPSHYSTFELDTYSGGTKKVVMELPTSPKRATSLEWIKYNQVLTSEGETAPIYVDVKPMELSAFLRMMYQLDTDDTDVDTESITINGGTMDIVYYTDRFPSYWTCFDDKTILFDAYNSDEDSNLVANKTLCYGRLEPTFTLTDSFTPELNSRDFSLLKAEVKSQAFEDLKQMQNTVALRKARQGWVSGQKYKRAVQGPWDDYTSLPNYGRKTR